MRRRGVTLIEVLIASIILVVVVALTFSVLWALQSSYNEASVTQDLEGRCRTF
ncbi:MAG: prepilin-type N-terminal cleavage/methylation domain-containing protein, partial [Planctomycetes bacterium]|nr:prepilin-type N-terminal cleavage/methylation domain-containing protein [Planctomycetota bacterium]